ncbi:S-layer homology domain-containing protein [Clostridia bacterium]|nr:S-layer homology domain-containing protein [Clostridia bacterium]
MNVKNKFSSKFFAVMLAVSLAFISIPVDEAAATLAQRAAASNGTGTIGEEVQIDFTMNDGVGLAGMQFTVNYDKDQFEIDESDSDFDGREDGIVPTSGLNLGSEPTVGIFNSLGYINIVLARGGGESIPAGAAGQVVNLVGIKFTIKSGAVNGTYPITITNVTASAGGDTSEPLGESVAGSITVTGGATLVDITAFDAIADVNAGTAGSATYADATAVIDVLPTMVSANTSAVTVPVTTWVDTDSYDPSVVGSYTFTATLGAIPAGFANPGALTASVEVVVASPVDITAFDAIADVNAGMAGSATYADATAVIDVLPTMVSANTSAVTVPVTTWVDTDSYDPSVVGSYTFTATLGAIPADFANPGALTASVEVVVAAPVDITAFDAIADVNAGMAGSATYADATAVIDVLPTMVSANTSAVTVPVTTWVDTDSYDPSVVGSYTFTATLGAIPAGFANPGALTASVEVVVASPVDITAFDAIADVNAGMAGSATYADATAVIDVLPTMVSANTSAVTVPVTTWVDTDSYDPSVVGSYTFTATLGAIPADFANPGALTASVEVVVAAPVDITAFDAIADVNAGMAGSATYADATAVIDVLPTMVSANTSAVTVPVTTWVDTDSYDPSVVGSYTFTATLGAIPADFANPGALTASVEVVVAAPTSSSSGGGSSSSRTYTITTTAGKGGSIEAVKGVSVKSGENATFNIIPNEGYAINDIKVDDKSVGVVNSYEFIKVGSNHMLSATFKKIEAFEFTDVPESTWYYGPVMTAYDRGWFTGTSVNSFSPNAAISRGMFVTVLWTIDGKQTAGVHGFKDVSTDKYYNAGVAWAAEHGIVEGYGEDIFGPNDNITREQLAVMFQHYAVYKGYDLSASDDLSKFTDANRTSAYARNAIKWAVGSRIINGKGSGILDPTGNTSRAEAAAMLINLFEK